LAPVEAQARVTVPPGLVVNGVGTKYWMSRLLATVGTTTVLVAPAPKGVLVGAINGVAVMAGVAVGSGVWVTNGVGERYSVTDGVMLGVRVGITNRVGNGSLCKPKTEHPDSNARLASSSTMLIHMSTRILFLTTHPPLDNQDTQ
jgi:hypothetical protein